MENFKIDRQELERFKSSYHAQTGCKIDDDMALFYFEFTRDRKLVIDIVSNTTKKVDEFLSFEKSSTDDFLKNMVFLQKEIENLTLKTDEKKASFLSLLLKFYHRRSLTSKYILGIVLFSFLAVPSYFLFTIYNDFNSFKSNIQVLEYYKTSIKGVNFKAAQLPDGAYVKKGILYIPDK